MKLNIKAGIIFQWTDKTDGSLKKGIAYNYENNQRKGALNGRVVIRPVDDKLEPLMNGGKRLITVKHLKELTAIGNVD